VASRKVLSAISGSTPGGFARKNRKLVRRKLPFLFRRSKGLRTLSLAFHPTL
jgi:hypothetical protein